MINKIKEFLFFVQEGKVVLDPPPAIYNYKTGLNGGYRNRPVVKSIGCLTKDPGLSLSIHMVAHNCF